MSLIVFSPAKINLFLHITAKRDDGYHDLQSVFRAIDFGDVLSFEPSPSQAQLVTLTGADTLTDDINDNLIIKAAKLLSTHHPDQARAVSIHLDKVIPTGAGLGGGSSNCAATLMALNTLWQLNLSTEQLMDFGQQLGADVPFFIFGENAFARGVGEDLHPLSLPKQWYVIVKPPVHVSTAVVFSHQGLTRHSEASIMPVFQTPQHWRNDMQSVVLFEYPEVKAAFEALAAHGKPMMSGSGACVFLRFESEAAAQAVYQQVSSTHQTYLAANLASHPFYG